VTVPAPPAPAAPATQVVYYGQGPGSVPVGDISTPAWVYLAFPAGLLALGALFGAVGKDDLALGAIPIAGSRVAMMLRQRRLDS
jgi:hypothetical protein